MAADVGYFFEDEANHAPLHILWPANKTGLDKQARA